MFIYSQVAFAAMIAGFILINRVYYHPNMVQNKLVKAGIRAQDVVFEVLAALSTERETLKWYPIHSAGNFYSFTCKTAITAELFFE